MKIQIDRISSKGAAFDAVEPAEAYDITYADFAFKDPIRIAVSAQVVSGNLVVAGKLSTVVRMTCSRCLQGFSRDWTDASYHFDCAITNPHETIDLTESIREDIIVGLPVKPLCREDCKGLCPSCGKEWNTAPCACPSQKGDIRWLNLNKLKLE